MIYKIADIMRDVRVALDYNNSSEQLVEDGDIDTLSLDELIRSKVVEAVRRVHLDAPTYLLESGHSIGDELYWGENGSGWVLLPDDFLRLVMFRMSDWERAVYAAISTSDSEYAKQSSRFRGIRGTRQKPVCVIAVRPEGRVLEFYSSKDESAQVAQGVYIPEPYIDAYGGIDISPRCYRGVVYMSAALVSTATGDGNKATALAELSKTSLQ